MLAAAETALPEDHLARVVKRVVGQLDLSSVTKTYSALGQRGYCPRALLALWVYASLVGIHHATQLARALVTDLALRYLTDGLVVSRVIINRFRKAQGALFASALQQTVRWAYEAGLIDVQDLSVDSVRLHAHASEKALCLWEKSTKRLQELAAVDVSGLSADERLVYETKLGKHTAAVALCEENNVKTAYSTNPLAGLIQFPGNGYHAGHRVTVTAAGAQHRLVVGVLVNATPNDKGLLQPAVEEATRVLVHAGMPPGAVLQMAADMGYASKRDLTYAQHARPGLDMLIPAPHNTGRLYGKGKDSFTREAFELKDEQNVRCPAGTRMSGPTKAKGGLLYTGVGCTQCPLRPRCTGAKARTLLVDWELEEVRKNMRQRMAEDGAQARYHRRMATVEPVFSALEDGMGYRRVSSRMPQTIEAEILLKLLAHNLNRLMTESRLFCVPFVAAVSDLAQAHSPARI